MSPARYRPSSVQALRAVLAVLLVMATLFGPLLSAASAAVPFGRAPFGKARAAGAPLDCSGGTIYAYQRGSNTAARGTLLSLDVSTLAAGTPSTVSATVVSTLPAGSGQANALGVTRGGLAAYAVDQSPAVAGSVNVYGYDALTQTWTTYTGPAGTGSNFVAGAVNRANGVYYYANFGTGTSTKPGTGTLYGFNTTTNTAIPGIIGTFPLPIASSSAVNGDLAFDALGNMYVLASAGTASGISRVSGPIPTTGSTNGAALTSTVLSTLPNPNSNSYNGMAFNNAGQMYVEFSTGSNLTSIEGLNPNTGAVLSGPKGYSNNAFLSVDLGACSTNPTLSLQKNIVGRFVTSPSSNDQFGLEISGNGISGGNTATTTGTATGVQSQVAGPVIPASGLSYDLAETAAAGASLANYTTAYTCVDAANGNAPVSSGTGTSFSLVFPATRTDASTPNVVCTFTNTPRAPAPSITIVKSAAPTAITAAGQSVAYSFLVTNTGNVALSGVSVAETAFSGSATTPVATCPAGAASLAPGASVTCTATYAASQTDMDTGRITNTAVASGTPPSGSAVTSPPSSATVTATANPALLVVKSVDATQLSVAGQVLHYSFVVTNSGNVTLHGVTVTETAFSGSGTAPVISCPAGAASLAPGVSVTCTASYTVTQTDIDTGRVSNTAISTGTPPSGPPVTAPPSSVTVPNVPAPSISVVKSAAPTTVTAAGQSVAYSFLVTNTGNVTLHGVTVADTAFSGTGPAPVITCPAGAAAMAPGVSVTCTASYPVTQPDINAGKVTNTAVATGTPPTGPAVHSAPSSATVTATAAPALTVVKSAVPTTVTAAGQTVDYSFLVTNTGNVTLSGVTVAETAFSGTGTKPVISCPAGAASLAPGVSVSCTASYTVTQADVDAGRVTNTAHATGTPPTGPAVDSPPSNATVTATAAPALTLVKSAAPTTVTAAGQTVDYSFLVTNTGNVTLTDVTVTETAFSGTGPAPVVTCPAGAASLAPGTSVTCTGSYAVTQADINAGQITNNAKATGTPPTGPAVDSPPSNATVTATANPALTLVKSAAPTTVTAAGQTVDYSFLITNTGNVTLTAATVTETAFSGTGTKPVITCPAGAASLAPGASVTCTGSYAVTQADINAGQITNNATATGTPPTGSPVDSPPSNATVTATASPALTLVKSATPTTVTAAGQSVSYSFLVTNTGNVTLTDVTVTETAFSGTGPAPVVTCPAGAASLAPAATVTCTGSYTVTQADINAGQITNNAKATGTPPTGPAVDSPPSNATVTATANPALTLVKSAAPTTVTAAGQTVDYSFLITNTGNVTLTAATVTETAFSGTGTKPVITCPAGAASLAPGASVTCTGSYAVTQADINAGQITNNATATGTPPTGSPVDSPPSNATVTATASPALTLVKSATPTTVTAAGQSVSYSFLVTNTGNVTLTDVTVTETAFSGTGPAPMVTCPAGAASLAPTASVTCTGSYTVTQADINAGQITNNAKATGTPPTGSPVDSPPSNATVTATPAPALTLVKSVDATELTVAGQVLHYSFLVTNTGNDTLTDVTVTETAFTGTGTAPVITCPAGAASLAPAASVTCTASYTVTQADIDTGKVSNTAHTNGNPPSGPPVSSPPSSVNVPNVPAPALTLVKSALPTTVTAAGQTVHYSFVVTNTGNVTLTHVTVSETAFSGTGTAPVASCPAGAAAMAPGASVTCTASYTVTPADINAGRITNAAVATGTPPAGAPVTSPPSQATVTATKHMSLTLLKSASPKTVDTIGRKVSYSFLVTNTGNVTLTGVTVRDTVFTGAGPKPTVTCPAAAASLAAGASVTCTASYATTQADIDAGQVTNTAVATGTPPTGPPVTSPPSRATVTAERHPAVSLLKTSTTKVITSVGQKVPFSFRVTNTGNVTLTRLLAKETAFTGSGLVAVTCPKGTTSLAPGASLLCTAVYTVTQADLKGSSLSNTAVVGGNPPFGPPIDSPPSSVRIPIKPKPVPVPPAPPVKPGHMAPTGASAQLTYLTWGALATTLLGAGLLLAYRRRRQQ
ncbi:beta strand repeat-containing protein [Streptacidiphilus sp. PAMC 29251]